MNDRMYCWEATELSTGNPLGFIDKDLNLTMDIDKAKFCKGIRASNSLKKEFEDYNVEQNRYIENGMSTIILCRNSCSQYEYKKGYFFTSL